jgi:hypothetical protein
MIEIISGLVAALLAAIAVIAYMRSLIKAKDAENEILKLGLEKAEYTLKRIDEIKRKVDESREQVYQEKIAIQEQIESGDRSFLDDDKI